MTKKLTVNSVMFDGQDGGGQTVLFQSDEELLKYVNSRQQTEFTDVDELLSYMEEDEYERGYFSQKTLEYDIVDGELKLVGNWSFHWGQ